jgi:hypothetical protein
MEAMAICTEAIMAECTEATMVVIMVLILSSLTIIRPIILTTATMTQIQLLMAGGKDKVIIHRRGTKL